MDQSEPSKLLNGKESNFVDANTTNDILSIALRALRLDKIPVKSTPGEKYNGLAEISLEEVAEHDNIEDCWVVIYDRVYDVTKFLDSHPGGWDVMIDYAGMDCTIAFRGTGHSKEAIDMLDKYLIGKLPQHQQIFRLEIGGFHLADMPE
ncbi:unnamed protein product [Hermetia illucens]|uniref:Cytochrome b5 heme-binding domain-containing protein n=1 Tax=Hermetia illucens TaxID=343691 RepID=A0A7R8UGR0_HERIL|nr:cytochrome b5 [Hermetia illucens]CAD7079702.1 unnamed protein product [Hermetia illucens]